MKRTEDFCDRCGNPTKDKMDQYWLNTEHYCQGCYMHLTRFSFPISSEPVSQGFIDEVLDEVCSRGTVPFQRAFEEDVK
jgi:hypothetical protein